MRTLSLFRKPLFIGILAALLLGIAALLATYTQLRAEYPELSLIQERGATFKGLQDFLQEIARQKGALYAFEILRRADLQPGTDIHLLGHVVGDELYKQYGKDAIQYCTQEFRNACSHTVVVGLLLDFGPSALDDIQSACKKAPGGIGAYTMCFHGLGHGVLAYTGYDLTKTVSLCKRTGTKEYNFAEYHQCVGGAIMEIISGGGHDQQAWSKARPNYIRKDDPLSPCNQPYIEAGAKSYCYTYLTPALFQAAGANLARPDPKYFEKAFTFCRALPSSDPNREVCIGAFGKEFINLARQSDQRDIRTVADEEFGRMREWCALSGNSADTQQCLEGVEVSIFWGGENDPKVSVRFCSFLQKTTPVFGDNCFRQVAELVVRYHPDAQKRAEVCALLPKNYQSECMPQ